MKDKKKPPKPAPPPVPVPEDGPHDPDPAQGDPILPTDRPRSTHGVHFAQHDGASSSMIPGISGTSSTATIHSLFSRSESLELIGAPADGEHHHHHHLHLHPLHLGAERGRHDKNKRGARVTAPNTLVITMESNNLEERLEGGRFIRTRMSQEAKDSALGLIANQIHDLGELEWMLDNESKLLLRRHAIYWKCALSLPRRKMTIKETLTPLSATREYFKPLTKCQRYCRTIGRYCCKSERDSMNQDLMRHDSLRAFLNDSGATQLQRSASETIVATKTQERLQKEFDPDAPAYESFVLGQRRLRQSFIDVIRSQSTGSLSPQRKRSRKSLLSGFGGT